jgi:hypothetical protein
LKEKFFSILVVSVIAENPCFTFVAPYYWVESLGIQSIHKQGGMLLPIGIPTILENVVGEDANGIEVFAVFVWIGLFVCEAERKLTNK